MTLSSETYQECFAYCDKCKVMVLEVIEYANIENWDDYCGVCSKCQKLFCKNCVVERKDKIYCPECGRELMEFYGCSVYDLMAILEHDCQPFKGKVA